MDDKDFEIIKKKAKAGVILLTSRTAVLQLITFISTFLLTVVLKPEIFGIFIVVSAIVSFLTYFSDIGLAAALIQKKEDLTSDDLKTTFSIQMILVSIIVIISLFFSEKIALFYRLDISGLWLFRALVIAFFISSLKTIPSIILERNLQFDKFIIPQIIETLLFYLSVVILAWKGYGINSFTVAVLLRAVSGLIAIYYLVRWQPRLGIKLASAKKLLNFGIPFQINSLIALVKDELLTVYLGKVLTFTNVGYIGWAKKWSEMPLRLIMDNINKVSFPTFSRLQKEPERAARALEKSIFMVVLLTMPLVFIGISIIGSLVNIIPKYNKWNPALFSYYLFSISVIFSSISSLLTNVIQSIGKVKIILKLMVFWTTLTWFLIPILINIYGFNGVSIAMLSISLTSIITIFIAKKYIPFSIRKAFFKPAVVSLIIFITVTISNNIFKNSDLVKIFVILLTSLVAFIISSYFLVKEEITTIFK